MKHLSALLLALCLAGCGVNTSQQADASVLSNGCGMSGDARSTETVVLDLLKNRHEAPTVIDSSATLAALSAAKADSRAFDDLKGATVEGYLVKVTLEKGESCNCHSTNSVDWDFHCYLAPTADARLSERLVVEVTPRMRLKTLDQMKALIGKRLKVTGWLMDDTMHKDASEADNPGKRGNWRASCWEIHPVTGIEVEK